MEKILKGKSSIMYVYRNKSTGDFVDEDGVPVTTTIYVPKEYKTEFEKYLQDEAGNTIYNAEGYTNNWELDR